jgi:hypothetical protein
MKTAGWAGLCRNNPELVSALIARIRDMPADEEDEEKTASQHCWSGYISVAVVVTLFVNALWGLI